jgi:hypothetical protein
MTGFHYIVVGLCLVLLLWLLVQEVRRHRRSLLAARVVAVVLAVGALACMALPPGHYRERPVAVVQSRPERAPAGIVAMGWQRRLGKGERLRVQGRWGGGKVKILLVGMGEVLDSAAVTGEFELMTTPAVVGRAVYGLVVLSGGDTVDREEVPVEVSDGKPLKVLVLANSPDFENTFLMNWLGKEGNAVEARVAVSRGKIEQSFVNMKGRMSDGFDLVIADSSMVTPDLWRQVEEKGLGLLIRVDPSVRIGRPGMRVLARDSAGRVVVGEILAGAGKVIYSASNMSYSLWLAGRKEEYAAYWAMLLREVAREGESGDEWNWQPGLSRVGEPVELELASGKDMPAGIVEGAAVYLAQDAAFPWVWRGRYWPVSAGWQEAWVPGGDTSWGYAGKGVREMAVVGGKTVREWVAFPTWILYVIFLLSMFFLWVERKMGGMNG